jgi:hypothetical protein
MMNYAIKVKTLMLMQIKSRVFRVYSTEGASGKYYIPSQILFPFLCIGAHALGFVG